jgi:hypothetical protein
MVQIRLLVFTNLRGKMNMSSLTRNFRERILAQKIQLLEQALKANIQNPSLDNACLVAKARHELFVFVRGSV